MNKTWEKKFCVVDYIIPRFVIYAFRAEAATNEEKKINKEEEIIIMNNLENSNISQLTLIHTKNKHWRISKRAKYVMDKNDAHFMWLWPVRPVRKKKF